MTRARAGNLAAAGLARTGRTGPVQAIPRQPDSAGGPGANPVIHRQDVKSDLLAGVLTGWQTGN